MSTTLISRLQPGDLLATRSRSEFGWAIRFGAALRNEPNLDNHIVIFDHWTVHNGISIPWGLEGRPGGVGWVDCRKYLNGPFTMNNIMQPKTEAQRWTVCSGAEKMWGTPYDWQAIADDALNAFGMHIHAAWDLLDGQVPGHVVCSSYAAYRYAVSGLAHPAGDRLVSPADWQELWIQNRWSTAA